MAKDALGHGSNSRGRKPIPGHPYHAKTDAELRYIIKDASEAEKATRGMSSYNPGSGKREDTAGKYSDQVNDAASVLAYRGRGGASDAPSDQLHSGTDKSAAAPVHDSMASMQASIERGHAMRSAGDGGHVPGFPAGGRRTGYNEHGSRHGYNPDAVNDAIASQNRSGRGKIGGKEASAIHRLLKGR
jgi:hypothetical protein